MACGAQRVATADAPLVGTDRSIVVVAAQGMLVGLSARTGETVWQNEIEHGTAEIAIEKGRVVASVGESLYCCEYASGKPLWRARTSPTQRSTLVLEGDAVYVYAAGQVDCFDARGQRVWSRPLWPDAPSPAPLGFPGNVGKADHG